MSASHSIRGWSPVMLIALSLSLVYPDQSPLIIAQTTSSPSTIVRLREPVPVSGRTTIEIDFAIWYPQKSGRLFSLELNSRDEVSAAYFPGPVNESGELRFTYCKQTIIGSLFLPRALMNRLTIHKLSMVFDPDANLITIDLDDQQCAFSCDSLNLETIRIEAGESNNWTCIWSWHRLALYTINNTGEKQTKAWDLSTLSLEQVAEDFTLSNVSLPYPGETIIKTHLYGPESRFFYAVPNQNFRLLTNNSNSVRRDIFDNPPVYYEVNSSLINPDTDYFWDSKNDILYCFWGGLNPLVKIDADIVASDTLDTYHFGASHMIDPTNGDFYLVGGYGQYRFQNTINKYNFDLSVWENIPYHTSDFFPSRCGTNIFLRDSTHAFIYGGGGSPQGRQENGRVDRNDLWLYSFRDSTMQKICDNLYPEAAGIAFAGVYRPVDKSIYALRWISPKNPDNMTSIALWQTQLGDSLISRELLTFDSKNIVQTSARYDAANDLILYLEQDRDPVNGERNFTTRAILFPLRNNPDPGSKPLLLFSIAAAVVGILGFGVVARHRNGKIPMPRLNGKILIELDDDIHIFIDGQRRDLSEVKLQKAIELLKLLAVTPNHELQHSEIKTRLWPHVIDESFKNSLYVALTAIRKIFTPHTDLVINNSGYVAFDPCVKVVIKKNHQRR